MSSRQYPASTPCSFSVAMSASMTTMIAMVFSSEVFNAPSLLYSLSIYSFRFWPMRGRMTSMTTAKESAA